MELITVKGVVQRVALAPMSVALGLYLESGHFNLVPLLMVFEIVE